MYLSSSTASKSNALNGLVCFEYSQPSMIENKAELLKLREEILTAFGTDTISADDLGSLPICYQSLGHIFSFADEVD